MALRAISQDMTYWTMASTYSTYECAVSKSDLLENCYSEFQIRVQRVNCLQKHSGVILFAKLKTAWIYAHRYDIPGRQFFSQRTCVLYMSGSNGS